MKHPHAELIKLWVDDTTQVIEFQSRASKEWIATNPPEWYCHLKYRLKPIANPYQHLNDARKAGKTVQWHSSYQNRWIDLVYMDNPTYQYPPEDYRIKPDPIESHFYLSASGVAISEEYDPKRKQVRVHFDPETNEIISVLLT